MSAPFEKIIIPPGNDPLVVCERWPECQCGDGCIDLRGDSDVARKVMWSLTIAAALIGAGVIYAGLLP